ncbi:hypothetical protein J6590_097369 [Homalodisca vitripennis]|nr:hypothetical protein J6590_097369 [Homalodisca vitripennis]
MDCVAPNEKTWSDIGHCRSEGSVEKSSLQKLYKASRKKAIRQPLGGNSVFLSEGTVIEEYVHGVFSPEDSVGEVLRLVLEVMRERGPGQDDESLLEEIITGEVLTRLKRFLELLLASI